MANFSITLAVKKATAGTIVFGEVLPEDEVLATPKIGTLYVPKRTLADMKWDGGNLKIEVTAIPRVK